MGCCNTRDKRKEDEEYRTTKRLSAKPDILIETGSREEITSGISNTKEFKNLLDNLISKYNTEIQCFSVAYYNEEYILGLLDSLLTQKEDELESKVRHLHSIIKEGEEKILEILRESKGLTFLMRWITCSNQNIRIKCAEMCHLLYKNCQKTQKIFIRDNGHIMLLQLMSWNLESEQELSKCLTFIDDLIVGEKKFVKIVCFKFYQAMIWKVFNQINYDALSELTVLKLESLKSKIIINIMDKKAKKY